MNLHNEIMNIPTDKLDWDVGVKESRSYKEGHRDARHAAAELSLKVDNYIERLESLALACVPESTIKELREECGI